MRKVLDDPGAAADLGRRGLERAREFSWERAARETEAVYREVAGQ
jgi:glycosyltransferase involved in cell wall biosynthesis